MIELHFMSLVIGGLLGALFTSWASFIMKDDEDDDGTLGEDEG